ncbi:UDP-2,4-diacetamido-2,4,6-trideoxy-beta-L-altropyranose hydrolase [Rubeoparvulum massiliense]|uniref:UDP-2,4-diacetamido-2,4, 6-trideoxy-beta-L-altropyranose hydrolase n=1 Tax=Rubeoparvulum massiliense TaxID=1631346 RepID=UPI00065E97BB|nr:UDP-2,4-diacetamido-2,4,6-trideoxy-beta-L-altropyranose hydrolase [Rubeoparvulum massiliense]
MYKLAFYADGGQTLGMGHIMRSLSLAKAFTRHGAQVAFFSRYPEGIAKVREEGYLVYTLPSNQFEAKSIISELEGKAFDILVVDHYEVTPSFFLAIKPYAKVLVYIDDLNAYRYPVDIIINGNITGEYLKYEALYEEQVFLLGPQYNLIREEFKGLPQRHVNKSVRDILITTGGSDPHHLTEWIIQAIRSEPRMKEISLHVVIGNSFQFDEQLKKKLNSDNHIHFYKNIARISELMLRADLAISSSGSTLYELCACGVPTLGFIMADNQQMISEQMDQCGFIKSMGWYTEVSSRQLIDNLKHLMDDYITRQEMVSKQQSLVDGKGTERIVEKIISHLLEKGM